MSINIQAGSRNEAGFIASLERQGFTRTKSGAELIANAGDAGATEIHFDVISEDHCIRVRDNGKGMTTMEHQHFYDSGRENHAGDASMGVSGMGGVSALFNLSKDDAGVPRPTETHCKSAHGPHLKSCPPWNTIKQECRYDGMTSIVSMSDQEIATFPMEYGTIHMIPYSDALFGLLKAQASEKPDTDVISYDDWWSIVFGCVPIDIYINLGDGLPSIKLKKYNYMGGHETEYYTGKSEDIIRLIQDERGIMQFITYNSDTEEWEGFKNRKNGCEKVLSTIPLTHCKELGQWTISNAMRTDPRIFDPLHPSLPNATFWLNSYDNEFFDCPQGKTEMLKSHLSRISLYRNLQRITDFNLNGEKSGASRASGDAMVKMVYLQTSMMYHTVSKQNNIMDKTNDIQQNKNQHQKEFPTSLIRLIQYMRNKKGEEILSYFRQVIDSRKRARPVRKPTVAPRPIAPPSASPSASHSASPSASHSASPIASHSASPIASAASSNGSADLVSLELTSSAIDASLTSLELPVSPAFTDLSSSVETLMGSSMLIAPFSITPSPDNEPQNDLEASRQAILQLSLHLAEFASTPDFTYKNGLLLKMMVEENIS